MSAASRLRSAPDGRPSRLALPWWCETDRCQLPSEFSGRRRSPPRSSKTPRRTFRTWSRPACTSACQCGNRPLRRPPSSRSFLVPALSVAVRPKPTCASDGDVDGFPSRPGRSASQRHRRAGLFFQGFQLGLCLLEGDLVPLALQGVLGALERKSRRVQQPTHLIRTEADTGLLAQMRFQSGHRPDAEAITQRLWLSQHGLSQQRPILRRGLRLPPRRLAALEASESLLSIALPDVVNGCRATAQVRPNRLFGASHSRHQNDRGIAKDADIHGREPQLVQRVPVLRAQLPCCHDFLRATSGNRSAARSVQKKRTTAQCTIRMHLAEEPRTGNRYAAACSAALAGCGRGEDEDELGEAERAQWRKRAREWLQADLDAWAHLLERDPEAAGAQVQQTLTRWRTEPELAGLRDADALDKLPPAERQECRALWNDVDARLERAKPAK